MNLDKIKEISCDGFDYKQTRILQVLAEEEKVMDYVLTILKFEREETKKLIFDMNIELSRAFSYIVDNKKDKRDQSKGGLCRSFLVDKIGAFYRKYKGKCTCTFSDTEWSKKNNLGI